ncbi:hypothetical protein NDU88_002405 [Pleurodeles waltl]|uniref:G-protein coupled receptors family 1 profile domain-containing protein n=1 Tax=Pleurodeles waltl TaxID=8319 RepID=A0AAV7U9Q2_PLEWA|nr:hypothetical protein NDU88_002405 [Pleurodeles waltl]
MKNSYVKCNDSEINIWSNPQVVLALGIPQMIINLVAMTVNGSVIITIVSSRNLHRPIFILFCNLALSDLLVSSSGFWISLLFIKDPEHTIFGSKELLHAYTLYGLSILSAIYNLVSIGIERYLAVRGSLRLQCRVSKKQVLSAAVANWAVSIVFGCLPLMGWNCLKKERRGSMSTLYSPFCIDYLIFLTVPNFAVVLFLPLFSYIGIIVILKKQKSILGKSGQLLATYKAAEIQVVKTCVFIWALTMLSYTPFLGGVMWDAAHTSCPEDLQANVFVFRNLTAMMIVLNSLGNPIIYTLKFKTLGNNLMFLKCQSSHRIEVQTVQNV